MTVPDGVRVAQAQLVAGHGRKGDAEAFSERRLAFALRATADAAGNYEIKGTLEFGVCEHDSCHSKTLPIAIAVAAR